MAVRVTLLTAGFFIAYGVGTGPESETTIAFNRAESAAQHPLAPPLLDEKWLARWRRSSAKFPKAMVPPEQAQFATMIEGHRRFRTRAEFNETPGAKSALLLPLALVRSPLLCQNGA